MNRPQTTTQRTSMERGPALVLLAVAGPLVYGLGLWAAAAADGTSPRGTVCFDPGEAGHLAIFRSATAAVMALGATLLLLVVPWILGTLAMRRLPRRRATAPAWSLAVNSAALMLVCLLLRNTVGIDRFGFLAVWTAWTFVLLAAAWKPATEGGDLRAAVKRWGPSWLIGLVATVTAMVLFGGEHFLQCFNGDGTEMLELARSLKTHFLPYFDIEAVDRFGTVIATPALISSYWTCGLQLLLGENELATRLPFWIWWLGIFATSLAMCEGNDEARMTNDGG
ncbi:MAG: hypothetical protein HQ567_06200, partial [Candidatus Nealsonbacteria bacterium]|nr:hypothetical protein [Candidatus Nealsonbacteria bacterium]